MHLTIPMLGLRRRVRSMAAVALAGAIALGLGVGASRADAAVTIGDSIEAFIGSDMVGLVGYSASTDVWVERNGVVIAVATDVGSTVLNHDDCWDGQSPDILPGDVIKAAETPTTPDPDSMVVRDVFLDQDVPAASGGKTTISGRVFEAGAYALRFLSGDARHDSEETLPAGTFTGHVVTLNGGMENPDRWPAEEAALEWVSADGNELTVSDAVEAGTCGPTATTAVSSATPTTLNAGSTGVTISGVAADAISDVAVSVGGTPAGNVAPSGPAGSRTWSVTVPAAAFIEGANELRVTFTGAGAPADDVRTITKDTQAPGTPNVTPGGGEYTQAQVVTLNGVEAGGTAYYTTDGSNPTDAGVRYTGPITITRSQTLKVVQHDAAGNASPIGSHAYVITAPASLAPQLQQSPVIATRPPSLHAESGSTPAADALRLRGSRSLRALRRTGLRFTVRVSSPTRYLRIRLSRITRSGRRTRRSLVQEQIVQVRSGGVVSGRLRIGRRTRPGRYELAVAPARADEEYGKSARAQLRLTR